MPEDEVAVHKARADEIIERHIHPKICCVCQREIKKDQELIGDGPMYWHGAPFKCVDGLDELPQHHR